MPLRKRSRKPSTRIQIGPWSIKPWSRTIWFNVLTALAELLALPALRNRGIDVGDLLLLHAVVNIALRAVTREPLVERRSRR